MIPANDAEAAAVIAEARKARRPLSICGGNSRSGLGRFAQTEATLSTADLLGITLHEPAELVIAARAGTPLAEVERKLGEDGQELAFEPMDHRRLFGSRGEPTIGAVAACNISGPRRIAAGAARDALIGVRLVNGRGEVVKSGGRVVKNVTGLDLARLVCGAYGTLGLLTEVTFRVRPKAERSSTLVFEGLDDARAVAALSKGLGSPFEVSGAAHLTAGMGGDAPRTLLRIEGFSNSVEHRLGELTRLLVDCRAPRVLDGEASLFLWRDVRDAAFLAEPRERAVWRISVAPSNGPKFVASLDVAGARHFYDWGGGLVWLSCEAAGDAGAGAVRAAVAKLGGHATLVRAPAEVRAVVPVFEPLSAPALKITAGLKASFDPDAILNPGRMYAGV
ncbi:MAG: glycolate oxidase subunit GlcE [Methylobacteriaceae bacterium]|nr:glycolate oxidase subunit GlcE [Methylobacteriaceae bacterium]